MSFIKKISAILVSVSMFGLLVTGCNKADTSSASVMDASSENSKAELSIVATTFPIYDWVSEILGETAQTTNLTLLENSGVDLHSYQPTAEDIIKISNCDVFIYVGGESDKWVQSALATTENPDRVVINLLDVLGSSAKAEEVVEGMQEEEHDHEEEHEEAETTSYESEESHSHDDEEEELDEHVWLSLKNAEIFVEEIAGELALVNPSEATTYEKNATEYIAELSTLDFEYQEMVDASEFKTVLFGDRFPFRYLVDDYGITYYAAFVGCSAETEASFETIQFLTEKLQELNLPAVLTIDGSDEKIAKTIINNTTQKDQKILTMDSLQSVNKKDVESGISYLSIMQSNLDVLQKALNKGE